jgi:hypothetical protein
VNRRKIGGEYLLQAVARERITTIPAPAASIAAWIAALGCHL